MAAARPTRRPPRRVGGPHAPAAPELARLAWLAVPAVATVALASRDGAREAHWYPWALVVTAAAAGLFALDLLRPRRGPAAWAVGAFALLAVLTAASVGWALLPGAAFAEASRTMLYAAAFAITVAVVRGGRDAAVLAGLVAATCGGLALLAAVRLAADPPAGWFVYDRFAWPTGYPNTAAALVVLAFWGLTGVAASRELPVAVRAGAQGVAAVSLGLGALAESRGATYALALTAPVVLAVVRERLRLVPPLLVSGAAGLATLPALRDAFGTSASAETRHAARLLLAAGLVAAAAGAAVALADRRLELTADQRRRLGRAALAVAAVVAVGAGAVALAADGPERLRSGWRTFTGVDRGTEGDVRLFSLGSNRYDFWRVALLDARDEPLRGVGAGSYGPTYLHEGESAETPAQAHGQVFELVSTLGLPGLLLGVAVAAAGLAGLARRGRDRDDGGDPVLAGGFAAALAVLVHAQVDWHWQSPVVALPVVALLGAGAALLGRTGSLSKRATRTLGAAFAVAALAWVLPGWLSARFDERAVADGDTGAARRAAELNRFSAGPLVRLAAIETARGAPARGLRDAEEATDREPHDWTTWMALARAARSAGEPATASRACARARAENPRVDRCP